MATFDIIVPAYNAARYLPMALDSVIAQTFQDWRILLIDDGSQDETSEIAATYLGKLGDRLTYIHQENKGLAAARNTAIRNATAPLCALLDADDVWYPNRLEETLRVFKQYPHVGLTYGFVDRIDAAGRVLDEFTTRSKHGEGWIATYIYRRAINLPCPTMTFRRECVEKVGLFDETMRSTEDRDLWLRIAQHYKVALVPKLIAHYRISPQGMSTNTERMLQAQLQFIEKHYGEPGCGWLSRRIARGNIYRQRAEAFAIRNERRIALQSALRGFASWPFQGNTLRSTLSLLVRWARSRSAGLPA